jgi:hypothetical protein
MSVNAVKSVLNEGAAGVSVEDIVPLKIMNPLDREKLESAKNENER